MTPKPPLLLDLFEALAEIEALCATLAAQRARGADLPALEVAVERMAQADPADYPSMNFDFHDRVCRLARNGELARVADGLRQRLAPLRRVQLARADRQQRSVGEHRALVMALYERDGPLAGSIMRAHLRFAMREVLFTNPQPPSCATS
ncbi:GntR family transcriptional regulator [Paracoccus shandongensis]|uniref:GntR family transcriptional regulator n=1 Tax=Paracoccus shandongensis TaxID=2816048 RepID=UPI001A8DDDEA|nr:FCD domain-containing protein [Paracoccus shandongensis]